MSSHKGDTPSRASCTTCSSTVDKREYPQCPGGQKGVSPTSTVDKREYPQRPPSTREGRVTRSRPSQLAPLALYCFLLRPLSSVDQSVRLRSERPPVRARQRVPEFPWGRFRAALLHDRTQWSTSSGPSPIGRPASAGHPSPQPIMIFTVHRHDHPEMRRVPLPPRASIPYTTLPLKIVGYD